MAIDSAKILFSDSFRITDKIVARHSTMGDVIDLGEERYFRILQSLTAIPSDEKWLLYKQGIDWMELSDLEFFSMTVSSLSKEDTEIFFPGLDFSKFRLYVRPDGDKIFADKANNIIIDFYGYRQMMDCLCTIHKIKKKVEKAGNSYTKQILLEEDEERVKRAMNNPKEFKSTLTPLVSSMVNREGFKYDYQTVRDMRFGQFMDAATRLQLIVATDQLIQGIYAGTVDSSKIDKKRMDWTREL